MNATDCPHDGCEAPVRIKPATEMPTLVNESAGSKTTFDVKFCDAGHILRYIDRQQTFHTE